MADSLSGEVPPQQAELELPTGVERPKLHYVTALSLSSVSQACGCVGGQY